MYDDFMGDEELQMLGQKFDIAHPQLQCASNLDINNLCINKKRQASALFCANEGCGVCGQHETCERIQLKVVTKLLQGLADCEREFLLRMYEIEDVIVKDIQKMRRQEIEKYQWKLLEGPLGEIVQTIYFKEKNMQFNGKMAEEFFGVVKSIKEEMGPKSKEVLKNFRKEMEYLASSINRLKDKSVEQFGKLKVNDKSCKIKEVKKKQSKQKQMTEEQMMIRAIQLSKQDIPYGVFKGEDVSILKGSSIIPAKDIAKRRFIFQNLLHPNELRLLFKASQHKFSSKAFHNACNGKEFTLTIYRTQFGKTVAGFTPFTWNEAVGWVDDETNSSFLMSLDSMQKFELIQPQRAIFCHQNWGPCFGDDMTIPDGLDNCQTKFPFSYGSKLGPKNSSLKSWNQLCGCVKDNKFKLVDYEVYEVLW